MASGKLGFPRPLLNETCNIRITAHNTGSDTLKTLKDVIKIMGGGFEFTIVESGVKELDGFPASPYVEISNNRIPFDDLSMIAEKFGKQTQIANEHQITMETTDQYSIKGTGIQRPVIDALIKKSTFIIEIHTKHGTTDKEINEFIKTSDIKDIYISEHSDQLIMDTKRVYLTMENLDDINEIIIKSGILYSQMIIACGTTEMRTR